MLLIRGIDGKTMAVEAYSEDILLEVSEWSALPLGSFRLLALDGSKPHHDSTYLTMKMPVKGGGACQSKSQLMEARSEFQSPEQLADDLRWIQRELEQARLQGRSTFRIKFLKKQLNLLTRIAQTSQIGNYMPAVIDEPSLAIESCYDAIESFYESSIPEVSDLLAFGFFQVIRCAGNKHNNA